MALCCSGDRPVVLAEVSTLKWNRTLLANVVAVGTLNVSIDWQRNNATMGRSRVIAFLPPPNARGNLLADKASLHIREKRG